MSRLATMSLLFVACAAAPALPVVQVPQLPTTPEITAPVPAASEAAPEPVQPSAREPTCAITKPTGSWPLQRGSGHDRWIPGIYQYDKRTPGRIALTFDDGPGKYTTRVLDVLAKHGVKATFFVVGRAIWGGTMPFIKRIVAEGHTLGNHTYRHDFGWGFLTYDKIAPRFYEAELVLTQIRVDLALLAADQADFEALDARVFGPFGRFLSPDDAVRGLKRIRARHEAVLQERTGGRSPYPMRFVRPPFGRPFYGGPDRDRAIFASVVNRLGLLHILWQGSNGDSDPRLEPRTRFSERFLVPRFAELGAKGGVVLAHERIPEQALDDGLSTLLSDGVGVLPLERLAADKFGCADLGDFWAAVSALASEHLGAGGP